MLLVRTFNSNSFKYKFNLVGTEVNVAPNPAADPLVIGSIKNTVAQAEIDGTIAAGRKVDDVKIVVRLKYLAVSLDH